MTIYGDNGPESARNKHGRKTEDTKVGHGIVFAMAKTLGLVVKIGNDEDNAKA